MEDTNDETDFVRIEHDRARMIASQLGLGNLDPADAMLRLNAIAIQALNRALQFEEDWRMVAAQRDSLLLEYKNVEDVRKHLGNLLRDADLKRAAACENVRRINAQVRRMAAELHEARAEVGRLTAEVERRKADSVHVEAYVDHLSKQLDHSDERIADLTAEVEHLRGAQ